MQRPFSFYKRDLKKNKKIVQKEEEPYRIFATPIPETSRNNFYQLIQEDIEQHKQDHKERWNIINQHK